MKKMICGVIVLFILSANAGAQMLKKKPGFRKQPAVRTSTTGPGFRNTQRPQAASAVSTGSYDARATKPATANFSIADPTIRALNARANGADVQVSQSGIVGMPKRAYGFANGHLVLNTSGATSSGTITGSGTVGTGSSLGSMGSQGSAIGLNGKSPYSGSAMWGNARGLSIIRSDSAVRAIRSKRN